MLSQRETYTPSGRANLFALALWLLLTSPLTLLIGYLLCLAFRNGFYLIFIAPILAGALAAGVTWVTVWGGACRNRWLGAVTGMAIAVVAFLSYYHFDFVHTVEFQVLHRLDWLPTYIRLRVANDQVEDVGGRDQEVGRGGANVPPP